LHSCRTQHRDNPHQPGFEFNKSQVDHSRKRIPSRLPRFSKSTYLDREIRGNNERGQAFDWWSDSVRVGVLFTAETYQAHTPNGASHWETMVGSVVCPPPQVRINHAFKRMQNDSIPQRAKRKGVFRFDVLLLLICSPVRTDLLVVEHVGHRE
jgi:hypothetical protein